MIYFSKKQISFLFPIGFIFTISLFCRWDPPRDKKEEYQKDFPSLMTKYDPPFPRKQNLLSFQNLQIISYVL